MLLITEKMTEEVVSITETEMVLVDNLVVVVVDIIEAETVVLKEDTAMILVALFHFRVSIMSTVHTLKPTNYSSFLLYYRIIILFLQLLYS